MQEDMITSRRHIRFARRFDSANAEDLFEDREGAGSANWPRLTEVELPARASPAATSARQPNLSLSTTPTETFARRRGQVMVTGSHASSWTSTTTIYLAHKSGPQIILPGRFVLLSFKWFNAEANDVPLSCSSFVMMLVHLLIGLLNLAQQPERDPISVKLQHTRSSKKYTDCATRRIFFLDCGGFGKQVWPLPKDAIGKFQSLWYYDHWLET
ncbi:hypothetical protein K438DRAFT_1764334 [Mycena galopus ATCC 62051]|nr:hypothetical protein K438DRAFT_1764334 [Mycena galopus ATCC 62051]